MFLSPLYIVALAFVGQLIRFETAKHTKDVALTVKEDGGHISSECDPMGITTCSGSDGGPERPGDRSHSPAADSRLQGRLTSLDQKTALEIERPIPDAYWVSSGRVLAGEYPGSVYLEDTQPKLRWLLENGVSEFVDLTEGGEMKPYLKVLVKEADCLGVAPEYRRRSIRDMSTPTVEAMTEILDTIDTAVEAGKVVYLHCVAGVGRTGLVVGCYLVRHGMSGEGALEEITRLRRGLPGGSKTSPHTESQRNMVLEWTQ